MVISNLLISFLLLFITISVYEQYKLLRTKDVGFSIDRKLIVRSPILNTREGLQAYDLFKNGINELSVGSAMTASSSIPGKRHVGIARYYSRRNEVHEEIKSWFNVNMVEHDFLSVYKIKIKAGRDFIKENPADKNAIIVSEKFVVDMGFESNEKALNENVILGNNVDGSDEVTIIGVVYDMNYFSAKTPEEGHVFHLRETDLMKNKPYKYYTIEISDLENIAGSVAQIKGMFSKLYPDTPFDFFFFDDYYNTQYQNEEIFAKVFSIFSGLAMLVTVMGLFGLIAYTTSRKTKEIGIRKVLGASVGGILIMLSGSMLRLALGAILIGVVPGYFLIENWLKNYSYRIDINWYLFAIPAIMVIFVTMATVSFIIVRSAQANPVHSLKNE